MNFQIGDRVRCFCISGDSEPVLDQIGIVRVIDGRRVGVEWDEEFAFGHTLSHRQKKYSENGHGYWVDDDCLELIAEDEPENVNPEAFFELLEVT